MLLIPDYTIKKYQVDIILFCNNKNYYFLNNLLKSEVKLSTLETQTRNIKFENFVHTLENEDLFAKTKRVDDVLKSGILTGNEALGMVSLNKLSAKVKLREKNGHKHDVIMLGSNSYLNIQNHPKVLKASKEALERFGMGMGAVSNYAGISDLHRTLEEKIAKFYNAEDAIVFPSGYGTNVGVISALCNNEDIIINDSANHASIFDGCQLSGAQIKIYPHRNMKYLEKILSKIPNNITGRLIITDGVFSMDGDIAPLDEIVELAQKYNCKIMVDDAHGVGIVGKTGRGSSEFYNVQNKIDLNVGMLSKAPGGLGGYCAAKKEIIQYLRLYARTYFFSTAMSAPIAGGLIEVFNLFEKDEAGRKELMQKTAYLKEKLSKAGFNTGNSQSAIIPVMIYDEGKLFKLYQELRAQGVYVNIVTYPAVRRKECRLRLCVMKDLSYQDLDCASEIIIKKGKEYNII